MKEQPSGIGTELLPEPTAAEKPTAANKAAAVLAWIIVLLAGLALVGGLVVWNWFNSLHGSNL